MAERMGDQVQQGYTHGSYMVPHFTILPFLTQVLPDLVKFMDSVHAKTSQVQKMINSLVPPDNPSPDAASIELLATS